MWRAAVVTGAASGIGAALCRELGRRGVEVVAADRDAIGAEAVAAEIRAAGGRAAAAAVDVSAAAEVESLADAAWARAGAIDLWINNAGIAVGGATQDLELDDWRRVLDVNLAGVIHGVHAVYPRMARAGRGHIVNVASVGGLAPYPFALPYTTSKHAVVGLSLALRAEARGLGVRVSVACPGGVATPIWERSDIRGVLERARARMLARMPARMTPDRCAAVILRGVARDRAIIPVTMEAHLAWRLMRLSPTLSTWVAQRLATAARRVTATP